MATNNGVLNDARAGKKRTLVRRVVLAVTLAMLASVTVVGFTRAPDASAAGGAYTLNYATGDPVNYLPPIPFPDALTAPTGRGDGDPLIPFAEFNDGSTDVKVESLAPKDMALGQVVPFETKISVSGDTAPENGVITVVIGWNTLTTNGDDFGYDARADDVGYGVIGAFIDTGDGAHVDLNSDATVDSFAWSLINDEIVGIFTVSGLDDGDEVVLEAWLVLDDTIGPGVGGNVQSRLIDAATGSDQTITVANSGSISLDNGDAISTGNQTVPLLKPSDFYNAEVDVSVRKSDDVDPIAPGETLTYTIDVANAGPSVANSVVVYDVLDPNTTFVSASGGGYLNTDPGDAIPDGAVQWDVGAMAPGDTLQFTVTVTVNSDAPTDSARGEDLVNNVTVTTISSDNDETNNTDTEPTDVTAPQNPDATVTKAASVDYFTGAGEKIDYLIRVENTGDVDLTTAAVAAAVEDQLEGAVVSLAGPFTDADGTVLATGDLAPLSSWYYTYSHTTTADDVARGSITNVVCEDVDGDGADECDTVVTPLASIDVVKSPDLQQFVSGGTASFAIAVTNDGDVDLTDVLVTDLLCDAAPAYGSGDDGDGVLQVGETWNYTCSTAGVTGDFTNTAEVSGTPPVGAPVTDADTARVDVIAPSIDVVKSPDLQQVVSGGTASFAIAVTNDGDVDLTDVLVTDPLCDAAPAYGSGDDGDGVLQVDETWNYTCSTAGVTGDFTNTAQASGTPPVGAPVTDTDTAEVDVIAPSIDVVKSSVLVTDDVEPNDRADVGDGIDYTFDVTNTGDVELTNVTVTDVLLGLSPITCGATTAKGAAFAGNGSGTLAALDSVQCTATYTLDQLDIDAGQVDNTATATGTDPLDNTVTDTDDEMTDVPGLADIVLDKSGVLNVAEGEYAVADVTTITYTFDVTNTGNVTLTNVLVTDALPGLSAITCAATTTGGATFAGNETGTLAVGDGVECTATYTVTQTDINNGMVDNTALAEGTPPDGADPVIDPGAPDDNDGDGDNDGNPDDPGDETEDIPQNDDLYFSKTASAINMAVAEPTDRADVGDTITYTFLIRNDGNTLLTGATLEDALAGYDPPAQCGAQSDLAPGESTTCEVVYALTQADINNGEVVNNAEACAEAPGGDPLDSADVICEPGTTRTPVPQVAGVDVVKSPDLQDVVLGGLASFTIKVTNTGNVTLSRFVVTDALSPDCGATLEGPWAPGASTSYDCSSAEVTGDFTNVAVVTGTPPEGYVGDDPTDSDDAVVNALPEISVSKTPSQGVVFAPGEDVTFAIVVTNDSGPGDPVSITSIVDTVFGDVSDECGVSEQSPAVIEPEGSFTCNITRSITGDHTNTATVTGSDDDGSPVGGSDDAAVEMVNPSLSIEKSTNGEDADAATGPYILVADTVNWDYVVTNVGDVPVTGISVSDDDDSVTVFCPGDSLDVGKSMTCTASGTATAGQYANIGSVSGSYTDADGHVATRSDWDPSHYFGADPSIDIVKSGTLNTDVVEPNDRADEGDTITYSFDVENTGNVDLTDVTITDPLFGEDWSCEVGDLVARATVTGVCGVTYTLDQTDIDNGKRDNTATATGTPPVGPDVDDEGPTDTDIPRHPAHTLVKSFVPTEVQVGVSGEVTLVYTNTGNVTLTDVDITDTFAAVLGVNSVSIADTSPDPVAVTGEGCDDPDGNPQTVSCSVESVPPDGQVTVTVAYTPVSGADFYVGDTGQTSGATFVFYFVNGYTLYGSSATQDYTLLDDGGQQVPAGDYTITGRNQDIVFSFADAVDFQLHLSCSELYVDGWPAGGQPATVGDGWAVDGYDIDRYNSDGYLKDCGQAFTPFSVDNTANASASPPPADPALVLEDATGSSTVEIIDEAMVEITRDRYHRRSGLVGLQLFNSGPVDVEITDISVDCAGCAVEEPTLPLMLATRGKVWIQVSGTGNTSFIATVTLASGSTYQYTYTP